MPLFYSMISPNVYMTKYIRLASFGYPSFFVSINERLTTKYFHEISKDRYGWLILVCNNRVFPISFSVIGCKFYRFYRITRELKNPKCYPHWEVSPAPLRPLIFRSCMLPLSYLPCVVKSQLCSMILWFQKE